MVKKLSCGSCGSLKRFPHTFTRLAVTLYARARGHCASLPYFALKNEA